MMDAVFENRLLARWAQLLPRRPDQLGAIHDADCELVPLDADTLLALTVDAVDEEIVAGLYDDPTTAGRLAAASSLSDLAAVGASPLGILLCVTLPSDDGAVLDEVALGVAAACSAAGTFVLGGDTSIGSVLRVSCVGAGIVPRSRVLRRLGLRPGDRLYASGKLGAGAALAASKLLGVRGMREDTFRPVPRLVHGRALGGIASACIDTSDGLVAAVDQLARLNRVAIDITTPLDALLVPAAVTLRARASVDAFTVLAAPHGELELVFGVPEERREALAAAAAAIGWEPLPIGVVGEGQGTSIDGRPFDGAAIRDLWREVGGDARRWLIALRSGGYT